jgi:hypothetical protein
MLAVSAWYWVTFLGTGTLASLQFSDGKVVCSVVRRYQPCPSGPLFIGGRWVPYGWQVGRMDRSDWRRRLSQLCWLPQADWVTNASGAWTTVWVPIWTPLLLVALPTAFLWWRDRRRIPPDHCQKCGYNLTGNVSGICPECGTPTTQGTT